MRGKTTCWKTF